MPPYHSTPDQVTVEAVVDGLQIVTNLRLPVILLVVAFIRAIVLADVPMFIVTEGQVFVQFIVMAVEVAGSPVAPYLVSQVAV